ncbi:PREDICTED: protein SCO1 homolog 1, mitochondrial [Tarenaya hassleriana]|uniref:protein SCO1 homolog 1, mitochondrial n=1 Tax=Tarenaya hassleriana TaxID=28532 RepID=UPI00053C38C3|nr:PREDICTED: protein SCO1 homolog 1, mitochondrial [Tarenaya hassleriana]
MAAALSRTANRFRSVQRCLRPRDLSYLRTLQPSPSSFSHALPHGDSSLLRSILPVTDRIQWWKNGQRCLFSPSTTDTTSKPNSDNPETNNTDKSEKSGGSEGSDGDSDQKTGSGKDVRGGPVSWMSFFLLVATGVGLIFYYDREKKRHIEEINNKSKAVKEGPSAGKAAIGGPFSLLRDDGKRVSEKDFKGKWSIIYFGFTHCPDICPDELIKLSAAIDKIKEKSGIEVVPVFISVDPERDTVQQVHEYVKEFHPNLVGLTGTPEEIKSVARAYRVYYMKTEEEDSDYLVDHSIVMYLMSPEMDFVKFYGKNHDVDSLTDGVIKAMREYRK